MKYLSLFMICFIYGVCNGCAHGPNVNVYISNPNRDGFDYYDVKTKLNEFLPYSQSDKFTCVKPSDLSTILNYCKASQK